MHQQGTPLTAKASPHVRADSVHSVHSDMGTHNQGPNRGGFPHQGRGRGFNQPQYGQNMGFPPGAQYPRGPAPGRGGMPAYGQGRGGMVQYPNSPQPNRASPALPHSMPHHPGTPNMTPAMPMQGYPAQHNFPPPMGQMPPYPQVKIPSPCKAPSPPLIPGEKKNARTYSWTRRNGTSYQELRRGYSRGARQESRNWADGVVTGSKPDGSRPAQQQTQPLPKCIPPYRPLSRSFTTPGPLDLSPESGNFDRILTAQKQGYPGYAPPFDPRGNPMGYPNYPQMQGMQYMNPPNHSPSPSFQQPYTGGQYVPPAGVGAPPMSRNSSQVSERPTSSTGQSQPPVIAPGTPQQHNAQPKAPVPSGAFVRPKKSAAITIKNLQGEALDLTNIKAPPASPASSIQQSKTPPVVASTPTPPPKPSTPAHGRSESAATTKTAEQLKKEFQEQVRKTAEGSANVQSKDEGSAKPPAEESAQQEETAKSDATAAEAKPAVEEPPKEAAAESAGNPEAAGVSAPDKGPSKDPADMTEEELDAMFAEMEAEDKRREQEQAELTLKKKAGEAEAKKRAEADRLANAAENDRKLREQEREMERIEEEREKKRHEEEAKAATGEKSLGVADALVSKIEDLKLSDKKDSAPSSPSTVAANLANLSIDNTEGASADSGAAAAKAGSAEKRAKPSALNLSLNTKSVEPPQPSAALQSLKSARFLTVKDLDQSIYPSGVLSPNPAVNAAVAKKGKTFKYDASFLLQFQKVFTEQPSLEFNQQVKTLIGDNDGSRSASVRTPASGRQNSRGPAAFDKMGEFGAPGIPAKTLPAGTTSAERFAWSNGQMPRPPINPMPFQRGGAFPGGSQMARTPSSGMGGLPNSARQGSRSTRGGPGGSHRGHNPRGEAQAAKTMPLTHGQEVKPITISANGWKPSSISGNKTNQAAQSDHLDPEIVQRKVKAALNKMTPEKFDKIADQILAIAAQSKDESDGRTLRQVIQLTFEKATDEAHWASMYAKFAKRMLETMSPEIRDTTILDKNGSVVSGGALFRKYLLNRCQEEFERGWKVDLPEAPEEDDNKKSLEAAMLSEEYYIAAAAKRRGLGLVQFIGELYKLGMLTERIMHECVRKLVDYQTVPDEAEIESLSKLLRTIGGNLDATDKGRLMMDAYFNRIQTIIDMPDLPSRLKFMLMDVVDLRRAGWSSKEDNKGPKTLEEVRAEVCLQIFPVRPPDP